MDEQFELLFYKMREEMRKQTAELTESLTKSIMEEIDKKLTPIIEENEKQKQKICNLEKEIEFLKREKRSNNIIIFGLEESEKSTSELFQNVKENFRRDLNIIIEENGINKLYRLGKGKNGNKPRPVLCSFVNGWKKDEIMKNRKSLKKIYISEDYSKEVLEKRKALRPQLLEEKKKGNIAFLKNDKLIIREHNITTDSRKRQPSTSPQTPSKTQLKKQSTLSSIKANRTNALDAMRSRSNSLTTISTHKNQ
ncbi:unnamed protein product [Euphydryas editha]|uniref:Endonuclease-reverse transcriptase n=1 Tax=Euphydryas editha TaxID=104508 RepID=A0AAU9U6H0_EUPED|nr:unnamed protein product [Euphydryas editha]